MSLPADALSSAKASRSARISYVVAARAAGPLVRRVLAAEGRVPFPARIVKVGRRVNALARLQRQRPLRRLDVTRDVVDDLVIETIRMADCGARLRDGAILYFHGGGFFMGSIDSHLHVVANLARRTHLPVVHVEYRQHPEAPIAGSVEDCVRAYRWLVGQGAAKVVCVGDSAGGFLAFATAMTAQRHGLPAPVGVVGISPMLELDGTARAAHENASREPLVDASILTSIAECAGPLPPMLDELSPINGPLELMPPALIIAAESEVLRCDAERMYAALAAVGRPCTLKVWPRQLHGFPALLPFLPESKAAIDTIVGFIRACLAEPT